MQLLWHEWMRSYGHCLYARACVCMCMQAFKGTQGTRMLCIHACSGLRMHVCAGIRVQA